MNPQIENKNDYVSDLIKSCDVNIEEGLSILDSRSEKVVENREEFYKYSQFCENIFTISEEKSKDSDYIKKIEKNNKDCVNIFDQCLMNS
jgi:hypothetical protein